MEIETLGCVLFEDIREVNKSIRLGVGRSEAFEDRLIPVEAAKLENFCEKVAWLFSKCHQRLWGIPPQLSSYRVSYVECNGGKGQGSLGWKRTYEQNGMSTKTLKCLTVVGPKPIASRCLFGQHTSLPFTSCLSCRFNTFKRFWRNRCWVAEWNDQEICWAKL